MSGTATSIDKNSCDNDDPKSLTQRKFEKKLRSMEGTPKIIMQNPGNGKF